MGSRLLLGTICAGYFSKKPSDHDSVDLEVINEKGEIAFRRLELQRVAAEGWEGDALDHLGVRFYRPNTPPVIGEVVESSPGERAGLVASSPDRCCRWQVD